MSDIDPTPGRFTIRAHGKGAIPGHAVEVFGPDGELVPGVNRVQMDIKVYGLVEATLTTLSVDLDFVIPQQSIYIERVGWIWGQLARITNAVARFFCWITLYLTKMLPGE